MGFLRAKTIKGYKYFYWCTRLRSHKKQGGTGKVKSLDILLGRHLIAGKYLAFYLYTEEIPLEEYAEQAITYLFHNAWHICQDEGNISLKTVAKVGVRQQPKQKARIFIRSLDRRFDCRGKDWHRVKNSLQQALDSIFSVSEIVKKCVEKSAYCLNQYDGWSKAAISDREKLRDFQKNPGKQWVEWNPVQNKFTGRWEQQEVPYCWKDDADIILDESISNSEKRAEAFLQDYEQTLCFALSLAPKEEQADFKHRLLGQIQKLSKDTSWLNQYEALLFHNLSRAGNPRN
jgi:hypothetical protein